MGKEGKSKKIEKMSLAWCESMRGRKGKEAKKESAEEGRYINAQKNWEVI